MSNTYNITYNKLSQALSVVKNGSPGAEQDIAQIPGNHDRLEEAFDAMVMVGWARRVDNRMKLTPDGLIAVRYVKDYDVAVGHLAALARIPVLFTEKGATVNLAWLLWQFMPGQRVMVAGQPVDPSQAVAEQSA